MALSVSPVAPLRSNTIRAPSGDQRGAPASIGWPAVRSRASVPAARAIQTCQWPDRSDTNAMLFSSGEKCGICVVRSDGAIFCAGSAESRFSEKRGSGGELGTAENAADLFAEGFRIDVGGVIHR